MKIEDFINQNREALDAHEPSDALWQGLEAKLNAQQQTAGKQVQMVPMRRLWQMAAAFAVLLVAGLALQWAYFQRQQQGAPATATVTANTNTANLEALAPELAEAEQFYFTQISQKRQELQSYGLGQLGMDKDVDGELARLDSAYKDLKTDLLANGNPEVMDLMIQNLQFRMEILNQQLEILSKIRRLKNNKNETNS